MRALRRTLLGLCLLLCPAWLACESETPCDPDPCEGNSTCIEVDGLGECQCNPGYDGPGCADCAWGYQDRDGDAVCLPACGGAAIITCPINQVCDDSSGEAACACGVGYTGPGCQDCDVGYAPDGNGACLPTP